MSSTSNTLSNVTTIIGIIVGVISGIATIICCIVTICYFCKNKNRNNVWAGSQSSHYYNDEPYGRTVNTPYYYQQPTPVTTNTYREKF